MHAATAPPESSDPIVSIIADSSCRDAGVCKTDSDCENAATCFRGVCLCPKDFLGEKCEFNPRASRAYMPDIDPNESPSHCLKSLQWEDGLRSLLSRIQQLQFPPACNVDTAMVFEMPKHGLGANMHYVTVALNRAMKLNKAMVLSGEWTYALYAACNGRGHACHFEPYSNCSHPSQQLSDAVVYPRNDFSYSPDSDYVPPQWDYHGVLWYRSNLMHWFLRPNAELEAKIRLARNTLGLRDRFVGVHVRRGDACVHASTSAIRPPCSETEEYISLVERMRSQYSVSKVFLATDDIDAMNLFSKAFGKDLVALNMDRSVFEGRWFIEYRLIHGVVDAGVVTESTLIDLFLLRESTFFVGTFASQFSRLAFEMLVANKGYVPPYASVDYPWCFHYLEQREIPGFGTRFC